MNKRNGAFSLIELLMATAVLCILVTLLWSILGHASRVFSRSQAQTDALVNFRAASGLIGRDLRSAILPCDRTNQTSLQFILNPPGLSAAYKNRDALFWQTGRENQASSTGVVIVGYFVSWDESMPNRPRAQLCRLAIASSDPEFLIYSQPGSWITDDVIKASASATKAGNYRGLLARNVVGLWITLEESNGGILTPVATFDSRTAGKLPAAARFSMACLSPSAASRLTSADAATIRSLCQSTDPGSFVAALPESLRGETQVYTTRIALP